MIQVVDFSEEEPTLPIVNETREEVSARWHEGRAGLEETEARELHAAVTEEQN